MIAAIASAALIVAASLAVGQGTLAACGRRDPTWLAGPTGLALLLVTSGVVVGIGGESTAVVIALAIVLVLAVAGLGGGVGGVRRRLRSTDARTPADMDVKPPPPGITHFTAPLAAACLAALFAAIPFIAAGNIGILGVGLVNDDMASHLLLADWIREDFRPEPVLIDQGYPLGPHALVAGLGELLGASSIDVFAGLVLAIPALTALVAYSALDGLRTAARIGASALVALPYLASAYLAQEAFKEPIVALFLLAFALLLARARDWRDAVPLGVLAAGTVYVYSFPGLAWLGGVAVVWGVVELLRRRRGARSVGVADTSWPASAIAAGVGVLTLVVLVVPELGRLADFADFRALDPDRANEGGLGNLRGQISPLEALGIWPTSEFRLSAGAGSLPAVVFYASALLAAAAFVIALPRWLRRYGPAVPAALLTAAVLYLAARALGTVYTSAKALAIAAPFIALITLGGLFATDDEQPSQWKEGSEAGRRRLRSMDARTLADMEVKPPPQSGLRPLPALGLIFAIAAAFSSFLILRQAPVAPEAHANELAQIRPLVEGQKLLFLGRDNFILYELRGSKPFTSVRNFYDPYYVIPNTELRDVFSKFDFDSVTAETLARFPYVLTTRAAYASGAPPGYRPVVTTSSYVLFEKRRSPLGREPGERDAAPGRLGGCPQGRPSKLAAFETTPIATGWSEATVESGGTAYASLELPAGRWRLSLRYDATRPLMLTAPGFEARLPGNLDYRGSSPFWDAGTIDVTAPGTIEVAAGVERPPLAGRLLGAHSVAHLGELVAVRAGDPKRLSGGDACRGYVDWFEAGRPTP